MPAIPRRTPPPAPPTTPRIPPPPPRSSSHRPVPLRRRPVPETVYISSPSSIYINCLNPHGTCPNILGACIGQSAGYTSQKGWSNQEAWRKNQEACLNNNGAWYDGKRAGSIAQETCDSGQCTGDSLTGCSEGFYVNGSCDSGVISDSGSKCITKGFYKGEAKFRGVDFSNNVENQEVSLYIDNGHDPSHLYESLNSDDDFDSFDSDSEDECLKHQNDSGVDMGQLPDPPNQSTNYSFTQLAAKAGKHMKKLRRNWSLTKNDITKSLSRINLIKSSSTTSEPSRSITERPRISTPLPLKDNDNDSDANSVRNSLYASVDATATQVLKHEMEEKEDKEKRNSLTRKKNWLMFRKSTSMVEQTNLNTISNTSSTFYVTDTIEVDGRNEKETPGTRHMSLVDQRPIIPARRKNKVPATRPQSPPPPTPTDKKFVKKSSRSTSWYAEVGLFKPQVAPPPIPTSLPPPKSPSTCWYAEIGLYQQDGNSPCTSSAENSGCSITGFDLIEDSDKITSLNKRNSQLSNTGDYDNVEIRSYENEPIHNLKNNSIQPLSLEQQIKTKDEQLYQFYNQAVIENACRSNSSSEDSDYDGYEEIGTNQETPSPPCSKPHYYSTRSLWCEIPEVRQSEILNFLSSNERKLQEAKFEVISSEVWYSKSLHVLEKHFMKHLSKESLMSAEQSNILFGRVGKMVECSARFLADLEKCWQETIMLKGVCDVILRHTKQYFQVYISYCENQVFLDHTLKTLKLNKTFAEALRQLESSPECQSLSLYSFLMLPMQRITRLPLLIDAVMKRMEKTDEEWGLCEQALIALNQLVQECNEGARRVERKEETSRILKQLEFPPTVPPLPIPASPRYLVRSGELTQLISRGDDAKLTIGKKFAKLQIHLFLFQDVLVIGKKKGDDKYGVIHHCSREFIELTEDTLAQVPVKESQGKYLMFLTLLENHDMKTVEMLLMCNSETDKQRWCEAFSPKTSTNPDETIYELWDCPQVTAIHFYATEQPDELNLVIGDVINVTTKMADGWYFGTRIRDGESGWFPGNHTNEIASKHVRARNLKQRYRLLALTGNYLNKSK